MDKTNREVEEIYRLLMKHDEKTPFILEGAVKHHPQSCYFLNRYTFAPYMAAMVFLSCSWWFYSQGSWIKVIGLSLICISYAGLAAVLLLDTFYQLKDMYDNRKALLKMITNPLMLFFEGLITALKEDCFILHELNKFSIESLRMARGMIEEQRKAILHKFSVVIGSIDKVGIIPGLASIYFAITTKQFPKIAFGFAAAICIFYLLAFFVYTSLPRLGSYMQLIDLTIQGKKEGR